MIYCIWAFSSPYFCRRMASLGSIGLFGGDGTIRSQQIDTTEGRAWNTGKSGGKNYKYFIKLAKI